MTHNLPAVTVVTVVVNSKKLIQRGDPGKCQEAASHLLQAPGCPLTPTAVMRGDVNREEGLSDPHEQALLFKSIAQSCPTFCNPVDYTVYGILRARILEWIAIPFSRGSFTPPRD